MTGPKRVDPDLPRKGEVVAGPRTENGWTTIVGDRAVGTSAMALRRAAVVFTAGTAQDPRATLEATGGEDQSASGTSRGVVHQGNFFLFFNPIVIFYCLFRIYVMCVFLMNYTMYCIFIHRFATKTKETLTFDDGKHLSMRHKGQFTMNHLYQWKS